MAQIDVEELSVEVRHFLFLFLWQAILVRVHFLGILKVIADFSTLIAIWPRQYGKVKLGNHHLAICSCQSLDGFLILIKWSIESHVRLHTHAIHTATLLAQALYQCHDSITLGRLVHRIIVVVKFTVRIRLLCRLECDFEELFSYYIIIRRVTERTIIFDSLIHHIPRLHTSLVASNHRADMVLHAFNQGFFIYWISILIRENPLRSLRMPNKTMSIASLLVLLAQIDEFIGKFEVPNTFFRRDHLTLHAVLSHQAIELSLDEVSQLLIRGVDLPLIHCGANEELVLEGFTQSLFFFRFRSARNNSQHYRSQTYD